MRVLSTRGAIQWLAMGWVLWAPAWATGAEFDAQHNIEFARRDTISLKADIYLPLGEGPFPGVLLVHGGGWMSGSKLQVYAKAKRLVKRGYVVVAINYRLAPVHQFPAQLDDCRTALRWMRDHAERYRLDARRIAGFGYSAGGHLVCLLGLRDASADHDRLQAIVAGGAPNEFRNLPEDSVALKYWLGGSRGQRPQVYHDASPRSFISADDPPVFLFHGDRDRLVPAADCVAMHDQLKLNGVRTRMHLVEQAGHLKAFFDREATERAIDFLDEVFQTKSQE